MTHINGEPVELVETWGELRAGDIVWVLRCDWCSGGKHRGMLTRLSRGFGNVRDRKPVAFVGWVVLPASCPEIPVGKEGAITANTVATGDVYRVIDPLALPATSEHEKRPERVR